MQEFQETHTRRMKRAIRKLDSKKEQIAKYRSKLKFFQKEMGGYFSDDAHDSDADADDLEQYGGSRGGAREEGRRKSWTLDSGISF
jgi:hypothetical protein